LKTQPMRAELERIKADPRDPIGDEPRILAVG
jgi:hypothetical protein